MKRYINRTVLFIIILTTSLLPCAIAHAAEITLRFSHFWSPISGQQKEIYQKWADDVMQASNHRIKIELYPSSTLVKPEAQYDAVKNAVADITATVQGYTANRFLLTQIVELPGLVTSAVQGSCILQALYDEQLISSEYKETHPLFFFTHGPGVIHLKDRLIEKPKDLVGLRIRRPTTVVAALLESLGAQAVGMPGPESYQAMQRGVIDGVALPWEGMVGFRLNELAKTHTEIGGLYSLSFLVTMNKNVYQKLPADLKKVIDDHSGAKWSHIAATVFDKLDETALKEAQVKGDKIIKIDPNNSEWAPIMQSSIDHYLTKLEKKGLPAYKVYQRAITLSKICAQG